MPSVLNLTTGIAYLAPGANLTLSGTLSLADGSATAPSLTFANAPTVGIYNSSGVPTLVGGAPANTWMFSAYNGTPSPLFHISNDGRISLGGGDTTGVAIGKATVITNLADGIPQLVWYDVGASHPMTGLVNAHNFYQWGNPGSGALQEEAFSGADTTPHTIRATIGSATPTNPVFVIGAYKYDGGTSRQALANGDKIVSFRNNDVEKASIVGNGVINSVTGYQIGGAAASGNYLIGNGTNFVSLLPAAASSTPANPTGTTSTAGLMMGLAGAITPVATGRIIIHIYGNIANSTAADGAKVEIRTGTGTAPSNAGALTGTVRGTQQVYSVVVGAADSVPFSLSALVTGLALNTAIWIDVDLAAITGGTASINNVTIVSYEV